MKEKHKMLDCVIRSLKLDIHAWIWLQKEWIMPQTLRKASIKFSSLQFFYTFSVMQPCYTNAAVV